jgi:SAM-dependent methyltransferase
MADEDLRHLWHARDHRELAGDVAERRLMFGTAAPTRRSVIRVDLGCGRAKADEFIGLDRYPGAGVDVVADLNHPLPLRDDSVDLLYASHSLEHVADLLAVMKEIYRVCKHGAQVCIVAPYYHQALNVANPYHTQVFNEHTPRFWTNAPTTRIPPEEFAHPHAATWGTSESDGSSPGIDFRCLRMEFFYFPEYRYLPVEEQRAARKTYLNVCDQVIFHLLVVKTPASEDEVEDLAEQVGCYDPPFVTIRRLEEVLQGKDNALAELGQALATRDAERAELLRESEARAEASRQAQAAQDVALAELKSVREVAHGREVELERVRTELATAREQVRELEAQADESRDTLATQTAEIKELQGSLAATQIELVQVRAALASAQSGVEQLRATLAATERKLGLWQGRARATSTELASIRSRRLLRIAERWRPGPDLSSQIDPIFQNLLDDSYLFLGNLRRYRLQPSETLEPGRVLEYALKLDRPNLSGIVLAPIIELPDETGSLGIELATPDGSTIASARISLAEIEPHRPVRFAFPSVPSSPGSVLLRIDVRGSATSVRLFEWRKRRFFGLGGLAAQPFCAFIFD